MTDVSKLEDIIHVKFKNAKLLEQALVHRSFLNENHSISSSNERLEFLGDSVLSLLVSTKLYQLYPSFPEGKLTGLRSLLVKTKTLGELAKRLHYGEFLLMSRGEEHGGGRENSSLLADTFEAILGAIFLDQGLEVANRFLETFLFPLTGEVQEAGELQDYKSQLQELTQEKTKLSPNYRVLSQTGPDHAKIFTIGVILKNKLLARGSGRSKQEAEQEAARAAIEKMTETTV